MMRAIRMIIAAITFPVYLCIAAFLLIAAPLLAGYRPVVVLSGSMEPAYHVGSVLYYKAVPFEEIEPGDAITFRAGNGGALVTHRVVEKRELSREFVTKGDANETADPNPVSFDSVAGRAAERSIPGAGYLITAGRKPWAIALMAGILAAGILLDHTGAGKKTRAGKVKESE